MAPLPREYPSYKTSDVPWVDETPHHWRTMPGKAVYHQNHVANTGMKESQVLSLSYGKLRIREHDELHGLVPASFETYQIIEPGDIVCRPTDLQNDWNSLRFGLSEHRGIITSAYICLRTKGPVSPLYGHLLLHTYDLQKVFYGLGSGLRQNLDWTDFKYLPCFVPPLEEQAAIVRYLDHADELINRYISAKERIIALLEEQRQAIVHQILIRGFERDRCLKDSGIPWAGHIPDNWEVRRLRTVADISTGGKDTINAVAEGKYPFFVRSQTVERIDTWSFDGEAVLIAGDGVGVGKVFHYINGKFDYHQRVYKFSQFTDISGRLFYHYLKAMLPFVTSQGTAKSTVDSLRLPMLQNLPIVVPPPHAQQSLTRQLDRIDTEVNQATEIASGQINLIDEYRTRLIADVVTGQIDVRDAVVELPKA